MSYGRDTSQLGNVGSFRQQGKAMTQKPKTGKAGGGGGGLRFRDKFAPSMIAPDVVRLVKAVYEVPLIPMDDEGNPLHYDAEGRPQVIMVQQPMIAVTEHRDQRTDHTAICSGGPLRAFRKYREPCLGCEEHWRQRMALKGQKKRPAMGMSDKFVVSVFHYAHYHKGPQYANGQMKLNPHTQEPYLEWSPCNQHTYGYPCRNCQGNYETKFGHMLHWPMGFGHWNVLLSKQADVERHCVGCGGTYCIRSLAWLCQHCDNAVIDLSSTTRTPEEIIKMTTSQVVCPYCKQFGFLQEDISCANCRNPQRASLFNVDLWVMRVKQGTGDNETTVLQPSQTSAPGPINEAFASVIKPLDLLKIYAPTPLEEQARLFQLPMPGAQPPPVPMTAEQAARPYGVLQDGGVLVFGGRGHYYKDIAERFDPAADAWSLAAPTAAARNDHTATLMQGFPTTPAAPGVAYPPFAPPAPVQPVAPPAYAPGMLPPGAASTMYKP